MIRSLALQSVLASVLGVVFTASFALANPATLPTHPGYPMGKAVDPVRGQSLANDVGRDNAVGDSALLESQGFGDDIYKQDMSNKAMKKQAKEKPAAKKEVTKMDPDAK
jgi:hypothetical protein